jgi:histidinol dehydrogenase
MRHKTSRVEVETIEGLIAGRKRPIQKSRSYIPGGTAPLFSTVLMLAVPANIAGCSEIVYTARQRRKCKSSYIICC